MFRFDNFFLRCFLGLFLKSVKKNYKFSFVKTAENPVNVRLILNLDFVKPVGSCQMF